MSEPHGRATVDAAMAALYAAPFADFIAMRAALAKELSSAGSRDAASQVKSLRKPSRVAWSLNRIAHREPDTLSALENAVAQIVDAHGGSGDVRSAMITLRGAVRDYAAHAAGEARNEGMKLDAGDLSNAILAVLGNPSSYDELRSGRLTDVPAAGGLDFIASLPARPRLEVSSSSRAAPRSMVAAAEVTAARQEAHRTAEALVQARTAAEAANAALAGSEADVATAEEKLRVQQAELKAALQRREFARRAKESTAVELRAAEAADQAAQRRLGSLLST